MGIYLLKEFCFEMALFYLFGKWPSYNFIFLAMLYCLSSQGITKAHLWIKENERVRERLSLKRASIIYIIGAEERKDRFKKSGEYERAL